MGKHVVLHTSDWHLGHQLYGKRRDEEFAAFLDWLIGVLGEKSVNTLIIAGDIFDTGAPGTGAQKQYYNFLVRAAARGVKDIVITAGNHDSPAFLNAPAEILRMLRIHIIGAAGENLEDEIIAIEDNEGNPALIVCAVPYLRERDVKSPEAGESIASREKGIAAGIGRHYAGIAELAEKMRGNANIPVIGTGHLFARGGQTGDGVRDLYIGSLGQVSREIFGEVFDYVALGHLHRAQVVGNDEMCRYSGSPLPMSFAEAEQNKKVVLLSFNGRKGSVEEMPVPMFRRLCKVHGSRKTIIEKLAQLAGNQDDSEIWVEVQHNGEDAAGDLFREAHALCEGTSLKLLCVKAAPSRIVSDDVNLEGGLADISPKELFAGLLEKQNKSPEQKAELLAAFDELTAMLLEKQRKGEE